MKTINLDEFVAEEREFTLKGVTHKVIEMSVEDFVSATIDAQRIEAAGELGVRENATETAKHLHRAIPTLSEDELLKLTVSQMAILLAFVNGTLQAEAEKGAQASGN